MGRIGVFAVRTAVAATLATSLAVVGATIGHAQELIEGAGDPVQVSVMGPPESASTTARSPAMAHDADRDRILVVWSGASDPGAPADVDVYGAFLAGDAASVAEPFQITDLAGPGNATFSTAVAVAYNPTVRAEFLVVWAGAATNVNPNFDIWMQRIDAATGDLIGDAARISSLADPILIIGLSVAHNSVDDQYLVVWAGIDDDPEPPLERFEDEVYGQLLDGDGTEIGPNDLRISRVQGDGDTEQVEVFFAEVAHNPVVNEYLVVWDGLGYLGDEILLTDLELEQRFTDLEFEIFGQRLDRNAGFVGEEILISNDELPGPPEEPLPTEWPSDDLDSVLPDRSDARRPAVTVNSSSGDFLVVWLEDGGENGLARRQSEVFGRTLAGDSALGPKTRISSHGLPGDQDHTVLEVDLAVDPATGDYLVVWAAADPESDPDAESEGPSLFAETEVWGLWLDAGVIPTDGPFQLTETGPAGDPQYDAINPAVVAIGSGEYLLAWAANQPGMATEESEFAGRTSTVHDVEVFARRIDAPEPPPPPTTTTMANLGRDALTTATAAPPSTTTSTLGALPTVAAPDDGGGGSGAIIAAAALAALAAAAASALVIRRRRR